MGWASGTDVAIPMIKSIQAHVGDGATKRRLYFDLIEILEAEDWDTQDEAERIDPIFDEVLKRMHPEWCREEEDE